MKTAVKILVIITAVIGIIWAIVGFFGVALGGGIATKTMMASEMTMAKLAGSFIAIIAGLIFGIIAADKEVKQIAGIILSALLILSGVAATIWASFVAGPLYILSGILALIANSAIKPKVAEKKGNG
jgi:hypothetical protein